MPRIALVCLCLVGACRFDADYSGATVGCSDGICPAGLECREDVCREPRRDAAIDMPMTDAIDARQAALVCADPGVLGNMGGGDAKSTVGRPAVVNPTCNGSVMTGKEAVYKIAPGSGKQMLVSIANSFSGATAYVVQPCAAAACLTNMYATPTAPISLTTLAGDLFVVVDSNLSAAAGDYTLTVTITN
jgi:hypothetical protein